MQYEWIDGVLHVTLPIRVKITCQQTNGMNAVYLNDMCSCVSMGTTDIHKDIAVALLSKTIENYTAKDVEELRLEIEAVFQNQEKHVEAVRKLTCAIAYALTAREYLNKMTTLLYDLPQVEDDDFAARSMWADVELQKTIDELKVKLKEIQSAS